MQDKKSFKETRALIQSDLNAFSHHTGLIGYSRIFTSHSFRITFWYRLGHYLINCDSRWKKLLYLPVVKMIYKHNAYLTGIQFPFAVVCGRDLLFEHFGSIIVNPDTVIGDHFRIEQCVTIGSTRGRNNLHDGKVKIGNNVVLFAGSKVINSVYIGNNVVVGANAVVNKDLPDKAIAVGVPAKIINYNGPEITKYY